MKGQIQRWQFLSSLGLGIGMWCPFGGEWEPGPPSFPITTLHCEGIVLILALTLSSAHTPYKQSPLNLSLRPRGGSHQGHDPHRGGTRVVLDVARVHSGREVWVSWVPGVWSKGGAAVWIDMSCWPYRLFTLQGASGLKKGHWWGALKCMI